MWWDIVKVQRLSGKVGIKDLPDIPDDDECCPNMIKQLEEWSKKTGIPFDPISCDNLEEFNEDLYGYISRLIMQTYKERNNNFDLADAADEAYKLYNDWARQLTVIEDDYIKCSGEGKPWWRNRTRQIGAAQARWRGK